MRCVSWQCFMFLALEHLLLAHANKTAPVQSDSVDNTWHFCVSFNCLLFTKHTFPQSKQSSFFTNKNINSNCNLFRWMVSHSPCCSTQIRPRCRPIPAIFRRKCRTSKLVYRHSASRSGHRLLWLRLFMDFLRTSTHMPGQYLKIHHNRLLTNPFQSIVQCHSTVTCHVDRTAHSACVLPFGYYWGVAAPCTHPGAVQWRRGCANELSVSENVQIWFHSNAEHWTRHLRLSQR